MIECQCSSSGSQTIVRRLLPGRYYAVVSTRGPTSGNFSLFRESRDDHEDEHPLRAVGRAP